MTRLFVILVFGIVTLPATESWSWRITQSMLFLSAAIQCWRGKLRLPRSPLLFLLPAAAAWAIIQSIAGTTAYRWATMDAGLTWLAWLAAFLLACDEKLPRAIAYFSASVAAVSVLYRFLGGQMGPFVYENQYAAFIELTLPLVLVAARGFSLLAPAIMIVSVFVSGSVGGSILVVVEAVALLLFRRRAAHVAALAALVAVLVTVTGWDLLAGKLAREDALRVRRWLAASSIEMTRDRPWMGWGLGTWAIVYPAHATFDDGIYDNQAHNDWAQWTAEGGLPFLGLTVLMAVMIARAAMRVPWAIGLLFVLAHCVIDYHFQERPAFGALYFAVCGAATFLAASSAPSPAPVRSARGSSAPPPSPVSS